MMNKYTHLIMRRPTLSITLTVLVASLPIFFQNCSAPVDSSSDVASAGAFFAYESRIDHVAYMSCSGMATGYDRNAYFTFKAGAYNPESGIKLTSDFALASRNLLPNDKVRALQESTLNGGTFLYLGIKPTLQTAYADDYAIANFVGPLSEPPVVDSLIAAMLNAQAPTYGSPYVAEFDGVGIVESAIHQGRKPENIAQQIRNELANQAYLALTYDQGTGGSGAIGPSETSAYGTGYRMSFVPGGSQPGANPRIMSSIQEYNLLDSQPTGAAWNCSSNWRFKIIRRADLNLSAGSTCSPRDYNATEFAALTAAQQETYLTVRRLLPSSEWSVDIVRKCIVRPAARATADQCYPAGTNINYNDGNACVSPTSCPHYLSLCKRR